MHSIGFPPNCFQETSTARPTRTFEVRKEWREAIKSFAPAWFEYGTVFNTRKMNICKTRWKSAVEWLNREQSQCVGQTSHQ